MQPPTFVPWNGTLPYNTFALGYYEPGGDPLYACRFQTSALKDFPADGMLPGFLNGPNAQVCEGQYSGQIATSYHFEVALDPGTIAFSDWKGNIPGAAFALGYHNPGGDSLYACRVLASKAPHFPSDGLLPGFINGPYATKCEGHYSGGIVSSSDIGGVQVAIVI